jgi:hypothetical protein
MKNVLLFSLTATLLLSASVTSLAGEPNLRELKLVAQLPSDLPQRITGLAYDGEKLWATIYHGHGVYAMLDPETLSWGFDKEFKHAQTIGRVAGAFESPGGICFAKGKLWITGSYGDSFGAIDMQTWKVEQLFKGRQRTDVASQSYASVAYDGSYLWLGWHWLRYDLPVSETQLLLKVEPESGRVVAQYSAPAGTKNDLTRGLTWDGSKLWHIKDHKLTSIDPATGEVTAQYVLEAINRPSGLAWVNDALWISEFYGKIWRLPFGE